MDLERIFRSRPFKTRNADEYEISNVLNLFVSPLDGLKTPFDFENTIIKGRMGSGKTMYLRANYACYISNLVPSLMSEDDELIFPVFIRLSDFQHLSVPEEIYSSIVIKIIEELASIYTLLEDTRNLAELQSGMKLLTSSNFQSENISSTMTQLAKLKSEDYIQRITNEFGLDGNVKASFFNASAKWKETNFQEIKQKTSPGIKDIEECYKNLLEDKDGKIILLIDEAGSLDRSFFKADNRNQCLFEVLMNQFRTASFIRTKIAVYPKSYSDMLTETRYGDIVNLEESVTDKRDYIRYRKRSLHIIQNYLNPIVYKDTNISAEDIFTLSGEIDFGDALEQILYASNGNMRRLIQLLDTVMNAAYRENNCATKITKEHAIEALKDHAQESESLFTQQEKDFLGQIIAVCKARSTFKFSYPNVPLYKYTNKSQEYNLINIDQLGAGRKSTIYYVDYCYAILKDLPTHRHIDSERVYRSRSIDGGTWISRVAKISSEILEHASLPGKLEGQIDFLADDMEAGGYNER